MRFEGTQSSINKIIFQITLQGVEYTQGGVHNFRTDTVTFDYRNGLAHVLPLFGGGIRLGLVTNSYQDLRLVYSHTELDGCNVGRYQS